MITGGRAACPADLPRPVVVGQVFMPAFKVARVVARLAAHAEGAVATAGRTLIVASGCVRHDVLPVVGVLAPGMLATRAPTQPSRDQSFPPNQRYGPCE